MIDLHLHLDGSLTSEDITYLANMQNLQYKMSLENLEERLCAPKDCQSLDDYLKRFDLPLQVLQSPEAVEYAVYSLMVRLAMAGVVYAEIRFAPGLHLNNGHTQEEIVEASLRGRVKALEFISACQGKFFTANLILCCMRGYDNEETNLETIKCASKYGSQGVVAADLAGAEGLFPTRDFVRVFDLAKGLGVPFTIHAGEAAGPKSIYDALEFGAMRIGHGIAASQDEKLLGILKENDIGIEMCPTSNVQTKSVDCLEHHPIKKFLDMGLLVTINSDNMTVSNTDVFKEIALAKEKLGLTQQDIDKLLSNAISISFADDETKEMLKKEIFAKKNV